jgi:MFS family permease
MTTPPWWKPFWALSAAGIVVSAVVAVFLFQFPLNRAALAVGLAFVCLGIAYYIRVKPSVSVNRAVYILLGVSPVGFLLGIVWAFTVGSLLSVVVGAYPSLLLSLAVWCPVGAFIGDWVGKKRNYSLLLSI